MASSKKKVGRSEVGLVKEFCSRSSDEDLRFLADLLPQTIAFDRSIACSVLQRDAQVDKWLQQADGVDDLFARIDSIGDVAAEELQSRSSRKK
jgi:hypothetical protein